MYFFLDTHTHTHSLFLSFLFLRINVMHPILSEPYPTRFIPHVSQFLDIQAPTHTTKHFNTFERLQILGLYFLTGIVGRSLKFQIFNSFCFQINQHLLRHLSWPLHLKLQPRTNMGLNKEPTIHVDIFPYESSDVIANSTPINVFVKLNSNILNI